MGLDRVCRGEGGGVGEDGRGYRRGFPEGHMGGKIG